MMKRPAAAIGAIHKKPRLSSPLAQGAPSPGSLPVDASPVPQRSTACTSPNGPPSIASSSASQTAIPAVSIRSVLQQTVKAKAFDLRVYQNVMLIVAGLMPIVLDSVPDELATEVVDLLYESGVRKNEQWLDALENVNAAATTVLAISKYIETDDIAIQDNRVRSWAALLPVLQKSTVTVELSKDPAHLPHLQALLTELQHHNSTIIITINDSSIDGWASMLSSLQQRSEVKIELDQYPAQHPNMNQLIAALATHTTTSLELEYHFRAPSGATDSDPILQQVLQQPQ